jgi:hypothetical protein
MTSKNAYQSLMNIIILLSIAASCIQAASEQTPIELMWPGQGNCPPEPDLTHVFPDADWIPSGATRSPSGNVFLTDEGENRILEMNYKGKVKNSWRVKKPGKLEAIAFVPERKDVAYLGFESPATIVEYSLKRKKVLREWDVQKMLNVVEPGIEPRSLSAMTYLSTKQSQQGGYFYIGGRKFGAIFVAEIDLDAKHHDPNSALLVAKIFMPGLSFDLSSLSTAYANLWMSFSNPAMLFRIDLNALSRADFDRVVPDSTGNALLPINGDARQVKTHQFRFLSIKGIEGLAFAEGPDGDQFTFLHLHHTADWQSPESRQLFRFTAKTLVDCFESLG